MESRDWSSDVCSSDLFPSHDMWAGVTPYTSTFVFAECCVFVKQSQPPGHCGCQQLRMCILHHQQRTFSRSYGTILPSSFTRVLSSALVFSTRPPVSVWGTVNGNLKLRGFSWKLGISDFHTVVCSSRVSVLTPQRICLPRPPTSFHQDYQRLAHLAFSVPSSQLPSVREY